jgi:hypothetical protein
MGNGEYLSAWSPWVTESPFGGAPTLNAVNYNDNGASLSFSPPSNLSAGLTVTSYYYEISTDAGTTVEYGPISTYNYANAYGNSGPTSSPYTDPSETSVCQSTTTCSYRIQADINNGVYLSAWSPWVNPGLNTQLSASPSSGPAPLSTTFTLTTTDPSGEGVHYSVAFGDGQTATGTIASPYAPVSINHTYVTPGTFTVGASVTDTSGLTGSATTSVHATGTIPLKADAGESQTVPVGVAATFVGSGSQPSQTITSYNWAFGDGSTASGETVQHQYSTPGTYTATLTVSGSGQQATGETTVTVVPAPSNGQGLTIDVTDGTSPLSGASLAVITSSGTRYPATTDGTGTGVIAGLPDGTYTVYAYEPGYLPNTVSATQSGGAGSATITLEQGSVSQTTASSSVLDYQQILAAGLNPNDPANQNVFKFTINLSFLAGSSSQSVQVTGDLTGNGVAGADVTSDDGAVGGGGGGGGGGGAGCSGCVSFSADGYDVVGEPIEAPAGPGNAPVPALMWLIIPGQAQWLKEFFDVKMIVSNLAPAPFSFDNGSISINDLPTGLSLAPTDPAPTVTHAVSDVPAGGSVSSDWVLRGDAEGFYGVSATYNGTLDPIGVPIAFQIATQSAAIHVWGGSAIQMTVDADDHANAGDPYLVRVGLTNVADVPVYNAGVELLTQGRSGYIYQPDQQLEYSTAVIEPGDTFWTDYYRLIPDAQAANPLNLSQSFVQKTGGNVDVQSTIESHPSTPPDELPTLTADPESDGIHLSWQAPSVSGVTGYKIFYTPSKDTPFGSTPVASASATATSAVIPGGASGFYALSTTTANGLTDYQPLVQATSLQIPGGGTITLSKSTALIGNYPEKVSGTTWTAPGDTTVSINECTTTSYSAATCDAANRASAALGTGTHAGTFKNAVIHLAVGTIDTHGDTCGLAGSPACYLVVVGNTGDSTASAALGFTLPSLTVHKTTGTLGNYVDAVTTSGIPIGDHVTAEECDGSVVVPATVSTNCDGATLITGTSAANGKVVFTSAGVPLAVNGAYTDHSGGTCLVGTTCKVGIVDTSNADISASVGVTFANPAIAVHKSTAVLGNSVNSVKVTGFPIGDTVTAQECDSSVAIPPAAANCDAGTRITGTVAATGKVLWPTTPPLGVTMAVGADYSDSANGTCVAGGSCEIVVDDTSNPTIGLEQTITFAAPAVVVHETTHVPANYLDKVTAANFPVGDTVTAQECDSSVTAANAGTNCDTATQISGTVAATGKVTFNAVGVKILVGSAYSDGASGACPAGGTCEVVVTDSTNSGFYVAVPIGLAG